MTDRPICNGGIDPVAAFAGELREQGYAAGTVKRYHHCCRHLVAWLEQRSIGLEAIDEDVLERFAVHDCTCPGFFVMRARRDRAYMSAVRRFVRFMIAAGLVAVPANGIRHEDVRLDAFREWLRRHRGTGLVTAIDHARRVVDLLPDLGEDPALYNAALIRGVLKQRLERGSRHGAKKLCSSLRMYLRFLSATGACSPALVEAVPHVPRWRLAALPRYIVHDDVERVIASCDPTTVQGLRDRAILLLLARLALRGGDVFALDLADIDWNEALIRVAGKTRQAVALPLPQEVGDALLAYIERARPRVATPRVFLRVVPPFQPFATSSAITCIVRSALERAGIENANLRGAYLLRHSAATNMLREGATLDAVSTVLRHRSMETTTIYAKVDTALLATVIQPWIGRPVCR